MEHPHPSGVEVEMAAIRCHRFHDAESDLRLIGEFAWLNLFRVRLNASLKSVDRPEPGGDLGPVHPAHGCAEGVADGHAEECAKELILGCVWHITPPKTHPRAPTVVDAQPVES